MGMIIRYIPDLRSQNVQTYFPATFELANGQKLVVNELSMPNLNIGEIYFFYYQFDTAQQPGNSQTLDVTLFMQEVLRLLLVQKSTEGPEKAADYNESYCTFVYI